jgi:hypothetical protein
MPSPSPKASLQAATRFTGAPRGALYRLACAWRSSHGTPGPEPGPLTTDPRLSDTHPEIEMVSPHTPWPRLSDADCNRQRRLRR